MRLTKDQREVLRYKYGGYCAYCGETLENSWERDYLIPIRRNWEYKNGKQVFTDCLNPEYDTLENSMPSCKPCNRDKSSLTLESWREMLANKITCLNRDSSTYRIAKRFDLVLETNEKVVFWFEKYEKGL